MSKLLVVFVVLFLAGYVIRELLTYKSYQKEAEKYNKETIRQMALEEKRNRVLKQRQNDIIDDILKNVNKTEESVNDTKTNN